MYKGRRVAVVIPAYDVAAQIAGVIGGVPAFVDDLIVVDDAARDPTAAIVAGLRDPRVSLVRHERNRGVGAAVVTGFRAALERGADLVVQVDGDGQMDPEQLPALLEPIVSEGCAYAKGNRFLHVEALRAMPRARLVGNFVLTFLTKLASGYWHVFDFVNGYLAIDAAVLRRIPLERLAKRYFFESDLLIHLNVLRARVRDVYMPARYGDEVSAMRLSRVLFTFPLFLARGFWYRVYERHVLREFSPVAVFWVLGALLLTWGTVFGAATWIASIALGRAATTGTVMLAVLPFILGFQLVLQAILTEIGESPR